MVASAVGGFIGPVSSVLMRPVAGSMYWSSCALSSGILSSWAAWCGTTLCKSPPSHRRYRPLRQCASSTRPCRCIAVAVHPKLIALDVVLAFLGARQFPKIFMRSAPLDLAALISIDLLKHPNRARADLARNLGTSLRLTPGFSFSSSVLFSFISKIITSAASFSGALPGKVGGELAGGRI